MCVPSWNPLRRWLFADGPRCWGIQYLTHTLMLIGRPSRPSWRLPKSLERWQEESLLGREWLLRGSDEIRNSFTANNSILDIAFYIYKHYSGLFLFKARCRQLQNSSIYNHDHTYNVSMRFTLYPLVIGPIHSSNLSQLPGEFIALAFSITTSTLAGTHLYPWVKRGNYCNASCSRTQVSWQGFEPTPDITHNILFNILFFVYFYLM